MSEPRPVVGDPREQVKCACPRIDGHDCIRVRSGLSIDDFDVDANPCECHCHDIYEESIRDDDTE